MVKLTTLQWKILYYLQSNLFSFRSWWDRIAKIYDSPDLAENEATYATTQGGIDDAKD